MEHNYHIRRDTTDNWQAENPIIRKGEIGIEMSGIFGENGVEMFNLKIGDGVHAWNDLPYASGPAGQDAEYEWSEMSIRFKNPDGKWGEHINIKFPLLNMA